MHDIWRGPRNDSDLAGEVDADGQVWRGRCNESDLAGEVDADGQVWRGRRNESDLAGEVDADGQVWRGRRNDSNLAGQVDPPDPRAGGAALLLLLDKSAGGDLAAIAREAAKDAVVAVGVDLAVGVFASWVDPEQRAARRALREADSLSASEGADLAAAEQLLAAGDHLAADASASKAIALLDGRLASKRMDDQVRLFARALRVWGRVIQFKIGPEARRADGHEILRDLAQLRTEVRADDRALRSELARLLVQVGAALEEPSAIVDGLTDLQRLLSRDLALDAYLDAARSWAAAVSRQAESQRGLSLVDLLIEATGAIQQARSAHLEAMSRIGSRDPNGDERATRDWVATTLAENERYGDLLAVNLARLRSTIEEVSEAARAATNHVRPILETALTQAAGILAAGQVDLEQSSALISRLRDFAGRS